MPIAIFFIHECFRDEYSISQMKGYFKISQPDNGPYGHAASKVVKCYFGGQILSKV